MAPNINRLRRSMIPSLLHNPRTRIKTMLPPLDTSTFTASVVFILPPYPKPLQICFCLAQVEGTLRARPIIHQFRNREKPFRVSTTLPRSKPATDEQVAMDQLVKKRRNEQSSTVLRVLKYGRRQHYKRLKSPSVRICPPQRSRANDSAVVPCA